MVDFPRLKTSAVAQYPATRTVQFHNECLRFVDGKEQRYRDAGNALHRWTVSLSALDEAELAAIEDFFQAKQGAYAAFSFTDPWDGCVYPNCRFDSDELTLSRLQEMRGRTSVTIVENRE